MHSNYDESSKQTIKKTDFSFDLLWWGSLQLYSTNIAIKSLLHAWFIEVILYMGNIWWEKILANHTSKRYWWGKIGWISYSQFICQIHFWCICEYRWGKIWPIAHDLPFSPVKYFPCTVSYVHLLISKGLHGVTARSSECVLLYQLRQKGARYHPRLPIALYNGLLC